MSSTWGFKSLYPHQQSQNPQFNSKHSLLCGSGSVVERCLAKADIAGPNPVSRSMRRHHWMATLFHRRYSDPRKTRELPNPLNCYHAKTKVSELFYERDSDPRGSREPPNPVSVLDAIIRKYRGFFYKRDSDLRKTRGLPNPLNQVLYIFYGSKHIVVKPRLARGPRIP